MFRLKKEGTKSALTISKIWDIIQSALSRFRILHCASINWEETKQNRIANIYLQSWIQKNKEYLLKTNVKML